MQDLDASSAVISPELDANADYLPTECQLSPERVGELPSAFELPPEVHVSLDRWNLDHAHIGFVTRFEHDEAFAAKYPIQLAGGRSHEELWGPSDELAEFNNHIFGKLEVVESYPGPHFQGEIDPATLLPRSFPEPCA